MGNRDGESFRGEREAQLDLRYATTFEEIVDKIDRLAFNEYLIDSRGNKLEKAQVKANIGVVKQFFSSELVVPEAHLSALTSKYGLRDAASRIISARVMANFESSVRRAGGKINKLIEVFKQVLQQNIIFQQLRVDPTMWILLRDENSGLIDMGSYIARLQQIEVVLAQNVNTRARDAWNLFDSFNFATTYNINDSVAGAIRSKIVFEDTMPVPKS